MRFLALLPLLCSLRSARAAQGATWCYDAQRTNSNGCKEPASWKTDYPDCGKNAQSPINIITKDTQFSERLIPFNFVGYDARRDVTLTNNGHSVTVQLENSICILAGGLSKAYKAVQFHLHWGKGDDKGSEHTIDSISYPMELHIVHIREEFDNLTSAAEQPSGIAVLGFLYKEGPGDNQKYKPLIDAVKKISKNGDSSKIEALNLDDLIPGKDKLTRYFRYDGSLTTPPCSESVVWTVFREAILLSKAQLGVFYKELRYPDGSTKMAENFRPVQDLNKRIVYSSSTSAGFPRGVTFFIASAFAYITIGLQH